MFGRDREGNGSVSQNGDGRNSVDKKRFSAKRLLPGKPRTFLSKYWEYRQAWQKQLSLRELVLKAESSSQRVMQEHADVEWLDHLARECWPRIQVYVGNLMKDKIEPLINRVLPGFLKGAVKFKDVDLGDETPCFGPLEVLESAEPGTIECRCGVRLETSDLKVVILAMGLPLGVSKLTFAGTVSVVFRPALARPPFFGGIEIYMINAPDLDIEFRGAALFAQHAYVRPAIRSALREVMSRFLVLPNRIAVDLDDTDDVDIADLKFPDPIGVLRLTVLRAESLVAADAALPGQAASSDPYVVVKLGAAQWTTPVVKQNLNPVWGEGGKGVTHDFLVHDPAQEVNMEVYDEDVMSADDLIGIARRISLARFAGSQAPSGKGDDKNVVHIDLLGSDGEAPAGRLFLTRRWLDVRPWVPHRTPGVVAMLFAVKVKEIRGLPSDSLFPFKVQVSINGVTALSRNSRAQGSRGANRAMRNLCLDMLHKGECVKTVSQTLQLNEEQVMRIRQSEDPNDPEVRQNVKDIMNRHAATNPHWQQVLHVLVPDVEALRDGGAKVKLELQDKKGTVLGAASVNMDVRIEKSLQHQGAFALDGCEGATLLGGVRAMFLVDDAIEAAGAGGTRRRSRSPARVLQPGR